MRPVATQGGTRLEVAERVGLNCGNSLVGAEVVDLVAEAFEASEGGFRRAPRWAGPTRAGGRLD